MAHFIGIDSDAIRTDVVVVKEVDHEVNKELDKELAIPTPEVDPEALFMMPKWKKPVQVDSGCK